jgi:hypothetical protein
MFVGPQITLLEKQDFNTKLNFTERKAWKTSENVCRNCAGKARVENCSEIVQELILSYSAVGCNMSLKINFVHSQWDFFFPKI